MTRKLLNFALFQAGWFACVLGGARGLPFLAVTVSAVVIALNMAFVSTQRGRDAGLLLAATLIGFCVDSACLLLGAFTPTGASAHPFISPLWLILLWPVFATTLRASLGWLAGRYWLAAALGAVGGPLSYLAGARLGAAVLHPNRFFGLAVIAVAWAAVTPLLVWLAHGKLFNRTEQGCAR